MVFASEPRFGEPWRAVEGSKIPADPIDPARNNSSPRFTAGRPVYDPKTLESYLAEDLALIHKVKPDVIVGDFRLTLAVKARGSPRFRI